MCLSLGKMKSKSSFLVSKLKAESFLLSLIDVKRVLLVRFCEPSMFTTTFTSKLGSSFFFALGKLLLCTANVKVINYPNTSYFSRGAFGERSSVTAPNFMFLGPVEYLIPFEQNKIENSFRGTKKWISTNLLLANMSQIYSYSGVNKKCHICLFIYTPCLLVCKCGIHHLCHIFTPQYLHICDIFARRKFVHINYFRPVFNKSRCWTPSVVCLNKQPKIRNCVWLKVSFWMLLTFDLGYFSLWQSNRGFSCLSLLTLKNELRIPTPNRFHDRLNWNPHL